MCFHQIDHVCVVCTNKIAIVFIVVLFTFHYHVLHHTYQC